VKPRDHAQSNPCAIEIGVQYRTKLGKMYEPAKGTEPLSLHVEAA